MESVEYHYVTSVLVPDPNGDGPMKVRLMFDSGSGGDMRVQKSDGPYGCSLQGSAGNFLMCGERSYKGRPWARATARTANWQGAGSVDDAVRAHGH